MAANTVPRLLLTGDLVITGEDDTLEPGFVLTAADGTIVSVSPERPAPGTFDTEMHAAVVAPGLVDIHNHGLGGSDSVLRYWMTPEFTTRRLPRHGTTGIVATVVWDETDLASSYAVCDRLNERCGVEGDGAVLLGVHSEGPCVATLGGLPEARGINSWDLAAFGEFVDRIGPALRLMTISPSTDAASGYARTRMLLERGVVPALGHDKSCSLEQIVGALRVGAAHGARLHVTHTFNVQALHHREPGLANVALVPSFPRTRDFAGAEPPTVEAIGDHCHVSPLALQLLLGSRSAADVVFVTDAIAEPVPGKQVAYAGLTASVSSDGLTVGRPQADGGWLLCGSCTNLHATLVRLVNEHAVPLRDAVRLCSSNPARVARLRRGGALRPGMPCDAILLDAPPALTLRRTLVGGRVAWDEGACVECDGVDGEPGPWVRPDG